EMSVDEVSLRLASMLAADAGLRVPYGLLTGGERLTPEQIEAIGRAQDVAHTLPLAIIQPRPYLGTIEGIIAFRRRRAEKEGRQLGLVVIDQLTQVWPPERYRGRKVDEIGEITASLKQTALRFGVPILLLHQLNRAVEGRSDRRPQLADLRDSGSLEQDADTVTLCYRPDYYLAREEPADPDAQITWRDAMREAEGRFELIIAKERMGATGVVTLRHDLPTGRILDEGVMI
ncbi:MAG: replicative DNA helicase, partial [Alphaproteobacteria bacterium]|nr:replicative DNA helicase [Alphaproteobacteria bacterium]